MKSILLIFSILLFSLSVNARELKVELFQLLPNDNSAVVNPRIDFNGDTCALVTVNLPVSGCQFDGAIGDVDYSDGIYNLYLSPGVRKLSVKCPDHDNLILEFGSVSSVKSLSSSKVYQLSLSSVDNAIASDFDILNDDTQKLKVISMESLQTDISARTNERFDSNGNRCALVKLALPIPNCEFEGTIGSSDFHINEYWVYLSPEHPEFTVKCPGFSAFKIDVESYSPNKEVASGNTYKLSMSGYDTSLINFTENFANTVRKYDDIESFSEGLFRVKKNNLYGVINIEGEEIVPCKYDRIGEYNEGYFSVEKGNLGNIVDLSGNELFPWKYDFVEYDSDGVFAVLKNINRKGYIDLEGNEIVPCIYHFRFMIKVGNLVSANDDNDEEITYDIKNRKVIPNYSLDLRPVYDEYNRKKRNFYIKYLEEDKSILVNEKGEKISPYVYNDFFSIHNGFLAMTDALLVKRNGKWGYVNEYGYEIIAPVYDDAIPFFGNYAMVYQRGKGISIINNKGTTLANFGPSSSIKRSEGGWWSPDFYADEDIQGLIVKKNGKYGLIGQGGRELVPCIYDYLGYIGEQLFIAEKNEKEGYIDKNGNIIIPFIYDRCHAFHDGLAAVCKNDKWGYVTPDGKEIIPCKYENHDRHQYDHDFKDGFAKVKLNSKYGIINTRGETVFPFNYDEISNFSNGLATIEKNGKKGLINIKGDEILFGVDPQLTAIVAPIKLDIFNIKEICRDLFPDTLKVWNVPIRSSHYGEDRGGSGRDTSVSLNAVTPTLHPMRPKHFYGYSRPVPPPAWQPGSKPLFSTVFGLTFGTNINTAIDALITNGYPVDGYTNNMVYVNDAVQLNTRWPFGALLFNNGLLSGAEFTYSSDSRDLTRYNMAYVRLSSLYGPPISTNADDDNLSATWWGLRGQYVALRFDYRASEDGNNNYYTTLSFGI